MTMFNTKGIGLTRIKSQQPKPTAELQERKVMLCVWWDHCSIIHFEILN